MSYIHQTIDSPVGPLHLVADDESLHVVTFQKTWPLFKKNSTDSRTRHHQFWTKRNDNSPITSTEKAARLICR